MKKFLLIMALLVGMFTVPTTARAEIAPDSVTTDVTEDQADENLSKLSFNTKDIIFDHLGDGYGWEVPFDHHHRIPLPVIVFGEGTGFHVFSSARVYNGHDHDLVYEAPDGIKFYVAGPDSPHKGKVVAELKDGTVVKPWDISITKDVCSIFITVLLLVWMIVALANYYRAADKTGKVMNAPKGFKGALEVVVMFIYDGVIKTTLEPKAARKFGPYLLTVFFFILLSNLMGLVVVFPGGANVTGNIAVTLLLALLTFFLTNLFGTKHYWKEIFWPDVPLWLKCPIPIMQVIEIFGIFTKPAALTVRLFANMMGGHMIVIVLTMLIFIFQDLAMGPGVVGATTVVSMLFSIFMLLIDVLVSFIQAYVFCMLSTVFIGLAQDHGHEEHVAEHPKVSLAAEIDRD